MFLHILLISFLNQVGFESLTLRVLHFSPTLTSDARRARVSYECSSHCEGVNHRCPCIALSCNSSNSRNTIS